MSLYRPLDLAVPAALMAFLTLAPLACKRAPAEAAAEPAPRTSPVGEGAPLQLAKPDEARVRLDLDAARSALRMHQQEHGSFPADLGALSLRFNYPDDLTYDAASGQVTSKTYPRF